MPTTANWFKKIPLSTPGMTAHVCAAFEYLAKRSRRSPTRMRIVFLQSSDGPDTVLCIEAPDNAGLSATNQLGAIRKTVGKEIWASVDAQWYDAPHGVTPLHPSAFFPVRFDGAVTAWEPVVYFRELARKLGLSEAELADLCGRDRDPD